MTISVSLLCCRCQQAQLLSGRMFMLVVPGLSVGRNGLQIERLLVGTRIRIEQMQRPVL